MPKTLSHRLRIWLLAGGLTFLPGFTLPAAAQIRAPAAAAGDTLPIERRAWIASKIYASIETYFGHWEAVPALDLDAAYRDYLGEALASPGRFEFDLATLAFMARLENGHSGFADRWLYEVGGPPVGFTARRSADGWVVHTSRIGTLHPGDVVQSIGGRPAEDFVAERLRYVPASSEDEAVRKLWFRSYLFPESFTVTLGGGETMQIDRARQELADAPSRAYEERLEPNGVAYLYIPTFGDPTMEEQAVAFLRAHSDAPALIVDVRANGGGSTPTALIEALMDRPYRGFTEATSVTNALFEAYAKIVRDNPPSAFNDYIRGYLDAFQGLGRTQMRIPAPLTPPNDPVYTGPVFVLTDGGCASACEDFVMPLGYNDRATVIGERTSGSTGQPYMHGFDEEMSFRVSTKRAYFPDGSQFEGVGIEPNIEIVPTPADLRAGRDPVLERAEALAAEAAAP
jgi:carboxyl-terminal processing protease